MTEATCQQRIDEKLENLAELMTEYMEYGDLYENGNDAYPPFHEYGLSFDFVESDTFDDQTEPYWRYQLSWGGPSDEIRFFSDRTEYWFLDWFDGAHRDISAKQWARDLRELFSETNEFFNSSLDS